MSIGVLFVDEEHTLEALRNMLHIKCPDWHTEFALGGVDALRILDNTADL